MGFIKKNALSLLAFCFVALVFLWLDGFYALQRFHAIGLNTEGNLGLSEYFRRAVFMAEYVLAALTLLLLSDFKKPWGSLLLCLLWILVAIELALHGLFGRPADLNNIAALNASVANVGDAAEQYTKPILLSFAKSALLFVPLLIKNRLFKNRRVGKALLLTLLTLSLIYGVILIKRGTPALIGFPKGFSYGLGSLSLIINNALVKPDKIETSPFNRLDDLNDRIKNIVVIVDESIEYEAFKKQFSSSHKNIIDLGRSFSGGNCSAASNYIIRKAYWKRSNNNSVAIKEVDSLFKLAKQKGFTTTYIDNQGVLKDPTVRNYFDDDELKSVDHLVENGQAPYLRDLESIAQIINTTQSGNNFILVNKNGAHFPYENTLEPAKVSVNTNDNYAKSIKRNALDFIDQLAEKIAPDTVVFYTSDHGQELNARAAHCNTGEGISAKEYAVPFLVITENEVIKNRLQTDRACMDGKLSHIEFSESIRNLMGIEIKNANSIFKCAPPTHQYCGLYGHPIKFFGSEPSCVPLKSGVD